LAFFSESYKGETERAKFLQERQSATLLAIALCIKFFRRQSLDGFLAEAFMFCKSVILLISWYMDTRFALLFGLGFVGALT